MAHKGKNYRKAREGFAQGAQFPLDAGISEVKNRSFVKFDETVDIDIVLGIDASKGDQTVRGAVILPHGRGKKARVIVFARGEYADRARAAGADVVGDDDLIEKIQGGWMEFEYAVATPDLMGKVGILAKLLGPRGLLPNKKLGTVTFDVDEVVGNLKKGQLFFKNDKGGGVHFSIGRVSFGADQLRDNLVAFIKALVASKPASAKGRFLKKMYISSTMGVGVQLDVDDVVKADAAKA